MNSCILHSLDYCFSKCPGAKLHYAECHSLDRRFAECPGAK